MLDASAWVNGSLYHLLDRLYGTAVTYYISRVVYSYNYMYKYLWNVKNTKEAFFKVNVLRSIYSEQWSLQFLVKNNKEGKFTQLFAGEIERAFFFHVEKPDSLIDPYKNSVATFKLRFKTLVPRCCTSPFRRELRQCFICLSRWICANTPIKLLLCTEPTTSFPMWLPHDPMSKVRFYRRSRKRCTPEARACFNLIPKILLCLATELLESYRKSGCRKYTFVLAVCEIIRPTRVYAERNIKKHIKCSVLKPQICSCH